MGGEKEKLGQWNCFDIVAIADDGVGGGNKRFYERRPAAPKADRSSALREIGTYLVTSLLLS